MGPLFWPFWRSRYLCWDAGGLEKSGKACPMDRDFQGAQRQVAHGCVNHSGTPTLRPKFGPAVVGLGLPSALKSHELSHFRAASGKTRTGYES